MHSARRADTLARYCSALDGCGKEDGTHAGNITAIGCMRLWRDRASTSPTIPCLRPPPAVPYYQQRCCAHRARLVRYRFGANLLIPPTVLETAPVPCDALEQHIRSECGQRFSGFWHAFSQPEDCEFDDFVSTELKYHLATLLSGKHFG